MADLVTFLITDGTNTVDLLAWSSNIKSRSWMPAVPEFKSGGAFNQSPFVDGRRLIQYALDNVVENALLVAEAGTADNFIVAIQNLRRLLIKAADYQVNDWDNTLVWVEAKAKGETNARFALVIRGTLHGEPDPYQNPFAATQTTPATDSYQLTFEHTQWQSVRPGTTAAINFTAGDGTYGRNTAGADYGRYVRNWHRDPTIPTGALTHVFRFTAAGAVFSANLLGTPLGYTFIDAAAINNAVYFGNDGGGSATPFPGIILQYTGTRTGTAVWEYWTGAAWATLSVTDSSGGFSVAPLGGDPLGVFWVHPTNWAANTVNGVSAYWVRLRMTGAGAGTPASSTNQPYTPTWGAVTVASTALLGDLPSLADIWVGRQGPNSATSPATAVRRVIMGLRRTSRDGTIPFQAYWTLNDLSPGTDTSQVGDPLSPFGFSMLYNPAGAQAQARRTRIQLDSQYAMYGTYRVFLRVRQTGGAVGDIKIQFRLFVNSFTTSQEVFRSETKQPIALNHIELIDVGKVSFPYITNTQGAWSLEVWAEAANNSSDLYVYDIITIPSDEWTGEYLTDMNGVPLGPFSAIMSQLEVVPNNRPKFPLDALIQNVSSDNGLLANVIRSGYVQSWQTIAASPPMFPPNESFKLWYLFAQLNADTSWTSRPDYIFETQLYGVQRYLASRGNR